MDNNDSNIKSQQTGGLKLMTVFIAVLALHVVVIGGFTVYHLMSGGSTDADLATLDKTHKGLKAADGSAIADGTMPDASQGDKSTPNSTTAPIEVASIPATAPTPAPDLTAPSEVVTPAPGPAPVLKPVPAPALTAPALVAPKPIKPMPSTEVVDQTTPTGPISSELAPPAEPAPFVSVPAPSAPVASGPVHMPPAATSALSHQQSYVVKITDSYKKIAQAHHITVAQLKEANHIKGDVLHTGQKLVIPSAKTLVATTAPAASLDSTPTGPILSGSASPMTTSLTSTTASSHGQLYTVVKGDTLIKIAHKFKTTPTAIMSENSITDPAKLAIGKKLKIPSRESRSAGNSAAPSTQPSQVQAKESAPSAELANFVP